MPEFAPLCTIFIIVFTLHIGVLRHEFIISCKHKDLCLEEENFIQGYTLRKSRDLEVLLELLVEMVNFTREGMVLFFALTRQLERAIGKTAIVLGTSLRRIGPRGFEVDSPPSI